MITSATVAQLLEDHPRSREARRAAGMTRTEFASAVRRAEAARRIANTAAGWAVAPRRRTRRALGVIG